MDHTYALERAKAALDDTDYNSLLERKYKIQYQCKKVDKPRLFVG